jgi:hypothetical protein
LQAIILLLEIKRDDYIVRKIIAYLLALVTGLLAGTPTTAKCLEM